VSECAKFNLFFTIPPIDTIKYLTAFEIGHKLRASNVVDLNQL